MRALPVLDCFSRLCCWINKRAQADKLLTPSIYYGILNGYDFLYFLFFASVLTTYEQIINRGRIKRTEGMEWVIDLICNSLIFTLYIFI
jgi:hypothetical protein